MEKEGREKVYWKKFSSWGKIKVTTIVNELIRNIIVWQRLMY